jgi:hypothetical protein
MGFRSLPRAFVSVLLAINCLSCPANEVLFCRDGNLCVLDTRTSSVNCIEFAGEVGSPARQPMGSVIAVELNSGHETPSDIVLVTTSGAKLRVLPKSRGYYRPAWSPDGKFIYALKSSLGSTIARWPVSEGDQELVPVQGVPAQCKFLQMIAFSPSGKHASILMDEFCQMLIAQVDKDAFRVLAVLPKHFSYVAQSVWIDDSSLLFVGKRESERGELWKLFTNTGNIERVGVRDLWLRDYVAMSRDRSQVIICGISDSDRDDNHWSLWRYSLADQTKQRLTQGHPEDVQPNW